MGVAYCGGGGAHCGVGGRYWGCGGWNGCAQRAGIRTAAPQREHTGALL